MVIAECSIKPIAHKVKQRKIHLFGKANWSKFKRLMKDFQLQFMSRHKGKSVEELCASFKSAINDYTDQCVSSKLIKSNPSMPWITQGIK